MKEKFMTLVKPTISISKEVSALTHITNEMVENAPPVESVLMDFYNFVQGCTLCGHNIIGFDLDFIRRYEADLGVVFDNPVIDTYKLAIKKNVKAHNFKLGTLCEYFGIRLVDAHRAWNDTY